MTLNPPEKSIKSILKERRELFRDKFVVGVHIRTGGVLSDCPEKREFVNVDYLPEITSKVSTFLLNEVSQYENLAVYISTDSKIVEDYISKTLGKNYTVVFPYIGTRGHSTIRVTSPEIVRRSVIDLYLFAQCNTIVIGKGSNFGNIASLIFTGEKVLRYGYFGNYIESSYLK